MTSRGKEKTDAGYHRHRHLERPAGRVRLSDRQHNFFGNDKAGFKSLLKWIGNAEGLRIVYEPTGPYHRAMEEAMSKAGHALVKVNPRQARRFAEATGTRPRRTGWMRCCWRGWGSRLTCRHAPFVASS